MNCQISISPLKGSLTASFSSASSLSDEESSSGATFVETPFLAKADAYGQVHPIESSNLLERRLTEFDDQLEQIIYEDTALKAALERYPSLFCRDSFRLLFLRADSFRVKNAIQRYARYWEQRISVFGEKAFQPITIDSLDHDSRIFLNRGTIRWIRRTHDRDILFFDPSKLDPKAYDRSAAVQAVWFILQELIEADERVQQKGVICLVYARHFSSSNRDPGLTKQCLQFLQSALPLRITAGHCTAIPTLYYFVLRFILCFVEERLRKRLIVHADIPEVQLAQRLEETYGMEPSAIPTELGGHLDLKSHGWCIGLPNDSNCSKQPESSSSVDRTQSSFDRIRSPAKENGSKKQRARRLWKRCQRHKT